MEMEGSDWHSKRLPPVYGHHEHTLCTTMSAGRYRAKRKRGKTKSRRVRWCGWGQVMQDGEFHCHVFPKERGACKFVGAAYSISSRNPQLVPGESSPQMCCVLLSLRPRELPFLCSFSLSLLTLSSPLCYILLTTQQGPGNQMLAEPGYRAERQTTGWIWNHLTPPLDIVQGERVIKGPALYRHKGRHSRTHSHSE